MKRIVTLLVGIAIGGALFYAAQRYHVLNTKEGLIVVPKTEATLTDTYVDVRNFSVRDWFEHRPLSMALVKANKEHLMQESAVENLRGGIQDAVGELLNGDTPARY